MNACFLSYQGLLTSAAVYLRWMLVAVLLSAASLVQASHFEGAKWTAAELTAAGQFSGRMLHINSKASTFRENSLTFNVYDADSDPGRTSALLSVNVPNVAIDTSDPSFEIWESLPALDLSSLGFGRYAIRYSSSARIGSVTNNASSSYSSEVVVNFDGVNVSRPPVFLGPPLVRLTIGEDFDFLTSAFVQSLEPVSFELLTGTAAPNNAADPIPGMNFNPLTGNFSMNAADTLNLVNPGFYVAKFQVITASGAATQWDIMFRANTTSNNPPQLEPVPGGLTVTIGVGDTYSQPIQASDSDSGQLVTLRGQDLPPNASLAQASGNPVNSTLTFTPNASQVNTTFPLVVEAKDNDGTTPLSDTVTISVTVVADASALPIIEISGNGNAITAGDDQPSSATGTNFGSVLTGDSLIRSYQIANLGQEDLQLTGSPSLVAISGNNAADYSVVSLPQALIPPGGSTTFQIEFAPAAVGAREAVIRVDNNDLSNPFFQFAIGGSGAATPVPAIEVSGNGLLIPSGDISPRSEDSTFYGSVDFVSGASITHTFVVVNSGSADLSLTGVPAVQVNGSAASDYTVTQQPSSSIAAGGDSQFVVEFNPSAAGERTATISIASNDANFNPYTFNIQGFGTSGPNMRVLGNGIKIVDGSTSPSLDDDTNFGSLAVGASQSITYTIDNVGSADLNLTGTPLVSLSGANAADFLVTSLPVTPITSLGGMTSFTVQFSPSAVGVRNASISIANDDPTVSPYNFDIRGTAVSAPSLSISPSSFDFSGVLVGNDAGTSFTLSNMGEVGNSLTLSSILTSGAGYAVRGGSCTDSTVLNGGDSCTVEVQFAPDSVAMFSGNLEVQSDAGNVSATLSGAGIQPAIAITPASLNFGDQEVNTTSAEGTVTIENTGSADLNISFIGAANAPFALAASSTCSVPGVLTPASSCSLNYTFSPTAIGTQSTSIIVLSDAPTSPASFSLVGNGVMPALATNPAAINFDDFETVLVGDQSGVQTVQLSNTGTTPLTIASVALAGMDAADFVIASNGCPDGTILNSGLSCSVGLSFAPSAVGARTASLQINSNAPTSPDSVALSGTGAELAALAISPASFDFGGVLVGANAVTSFTLSNSGDPVTTVTLTAPLLAAGSAAEFSISGGDCAVGTELIGGGAGCTVEVTFAPTSVAASLSGTLEVGSDVNLASAGLSGTGLPPAELAIVPTSFDFGGVAVNEPALTSLTISNIGDPSSNLSFTGITTTGAEFSISGGTCGVGIVLNGGEDCSVQVQFAPTAEGAFGGSLDVASDAGNASASLSGEGLAAASLQITPASTDFGSVLITESATRSFSLSNSGDPVTTVTLTAPLLAAGSAAEFSISGGDCAVGTELIGGAASCTVDITFNPTALNGPFNGTLEVGSDVNTVSAALTGASELPDWEDGFANTETGSDGFEQDWTFLGFDAMFNPLMPTTAEVNNDYLQIRDPDAIFAVGYVERTFNDTRTSALVNADGFGSGSDSGDGLDNQIDQGVIARFDPGATSGYAAYMRMELNEQELVLIKFDASNLDPALVDIREVVATSADADWDMGRMFITELDLIDQADGSVLVVARALDADTGAVLSRLEFMDPAVDAFTTGFSGVVAIANATGLNGSFDSTAAVSAFASADLAPDSIDFGAVATGAMAQQSVTLSNNGNDALVISDIAIGGAAAADYTLQNDTCTMASPLPAGASCTFDVELTAGDTGQRSAEVLIDSSASTSPDIVLLDAAVFASQLTLNPLTQDFGAVLVGADSSVFTFTVSNASDAVTELTLNSIANSGDFNIVTGGSCTDTTVLNGGESCTVDVAFAPNSVGMLTGSLDIGSDAGMVSATLSGTGLASAALAIDPVSFDFEGVLVGDTATTSFTLSNSGDPVSSLTLSSIAVTGADFGSTAAGSCTSTSTLNGGDSCTVEVQFAPTAAGAVSGSLDVASDAGNVTATLAGEGLSAAELVVAPLDHDFGNVTVGETSVFTFTLSNSGDPLSELMITAINSSGNSAFSVIGGTCQAGMTMLSGQQNCTVEVQFAPVTLGDVGGSLNVNSDVNNITAGLVGEGTAVAAIQLAPASFDFGQLLVGESAMQSFVVSNIGGVASELSVDNILVAGTGFSNTGNGSCTSMSTLNGGDSCTVEVQFAPAAVGAVSGSLDVASDAGNVSAALDGEGLAAAALEITPASVNFGGVVVGETDTATFTLSNSGDPVSSLTLSSIAVTGAEFSNTGNGSCMSTSTLNGGENCTVEVQFAPTAVGAASGSLDISSDVGDVSATLAGEGLAAAALAIDPLSVDFGAVIIGGTASSSFTLSNIGDVSSSLDLTSIAVTGVDFSVIGGDCVAGITTLNGGASCTVEVQFAPTAVGAASGSLDISSDVGDVSATLAGEGLAAAALGIDPISFDFGGVIVGDTSTNVFILSNTGDTSSSLDLTSIAVTGADFSVIGGDCLAGVTSLIGGATCTVEVQFAPNVAGAVSDSLNVESDAGNVSATLAGVGLAAATLAIDPVSFDFEGVVVDDSETTSFTVSNTGEIDSSLTLASITVTGDGFTDTGNGSCTTITTLNGGENCTVIVRFAPAAVGAASGSLDISTDVGDVAVSLSGVGLVNEADLMIIAEPLDQFGELGAVFGYIVVVTNIGPADVTTADVTSTLATGLDNVTWACSADIGATCPASGTGDLDEMVDLPAGSMVTFTILADLTEGDEQEQVISAFMITGPMTPPDPDLDNNDAVTSTQSGVFADDFESPSLP